jgi:hypothetical protein
MVHFYLFVMALIIFSAYLLKSVSEDDKHRIRPVIQLSGVTGVIIISSMWVLGYFVIDVRNVYTGGLGHHSMNLVSPINSAGYSVILK